MHSRYRFLALCFILVFYSLLYIATRKDPPCNDDCQKLVDIQRTMMQDHNYVYGVLRCTDIPENICVSVNGSPGPDWNSLADSTCLLAKQRSLYVEKVFVIRYGSYPYDTLARVTCP